jgi:hypothetical protein
MYSCCTKSAQLLIDLLFAKHAHPILTKNDDALKKIIACCGKSFDIRYSEPTFVCDKLTKKGVKRKRKRKIFRRLTRKD